MEVAGTLVNTLLQRVRDPQGAIHSRGTVRTLLSHAQRLINAGLRATIAEATLATEPSRLIYPISALLPNVIHVESVRADDRDLADIDWRLLWHIDGTWFRRTGDRFEGFARIGRDLLVLYPAQTVTASVTVIYTALTATLEGDATPTDLDDALHSPMLDLTEALLLLRARDYAILPSALQHLQDTYAMVSA